MRTISRSRRYAERVAAHLCAGRWARADLKAQLHTILPRLGARRIGVIAESLLLRTQTAYPPSISRVARWLSQIRAFSTLSSATLQRVPAALPILDAAFSPAAPLRALRIPPFATTRSLAQWLGVSLEELDWYADTRATNARASTDRLRHYHVHVVPKASGGMRIIEAPKRHLRAIQKQILGDILRPLQPHPAAHGFVAGRSAITHASAHVGEAVVLRIDLKDFFPSVPARRVYGIFRSLGYPPPVAQALKGLCLVRTPRAALPWRRHRESCGLYLQQHLPQGAATSPALANLAAWRMDHRLSRLASRFDVHYTRYADDLTFSGGRPFMDRSQSFLSYVRTITDDEGFRVNDPKTRVMPAQARQIVTGIVVNSHVNLARDAYDQLKAVLHSCLRDGPQSANRARHPDFRAYLNGRVSWVEQLNRARGQKLRARYDSIVWT